MTSQYKGKNLPLFATVTGSQMWQMERADSDVDIYSCYIRDSRSYQIHGRTKGSHNTTYRKKFPHLGINEEKEVQEQSHELERVIKYLKTGNVNFIFLVTSPLHVYEHRNSLQELRQIYIDNMSKNCYNSTLGMARNNMKDFIIHGDPQSLKYKKKLYTIGRGLQFGINLLLYKKPFYQPVYCKSKDELDTLMIKLNDAYDNSHLPNKTDPEPFDNYIVKWRLRKLQDDELI